MEITNTIFETLLTKNNFKKKEFAEYSKIPYDTVAGWKKKGFVPPYAMVILKDMIYRKRLDKEVSKVLKRDLQSQINQNHLLTKTEENRLKTAFWGTNFTTEDILRGIKEKNRKIMQKMKENMSKTEIKEITLKINF
ncbi:hypothetical protein [Aliarcobacter butzleri]|uniref:hypothetical protein n=1 Tax=Aliarcobacter butzleri TaxID=28197 RepID=UPI002B24E279|nr:hypothetical protein [Aliarcobacter butzleri]